MTALKRFIPTHVGNIHFKYLTLGNEAVHPHTRGEHLFKIPPMIFDIGSSPHTWGTCQIREKALNRLRFIPTHVGNMVV